jgi:glycosyltransferase involved in cell wall biosynthesis
MARKHAPGTPVIELPFPLEAFSAPSDGAIMRYRRRLGIPPGAFVFGVFGFLRESKRLFAILDAFGRLRAAYPQAALLIAGSFVSTDLERAVEPLLTAGGVFRLPYLSGPEFRLAACAVDACINLRYPSAGETSAIAIQLMGLGKPVLLTESEECARFPEDAAIRIGIGIEERESLWSHMVLLTSLPGVVRAIGQRGFWHVQEHHQVERVAQQYWEILCGFRS